MNARLRGLRKRVRRMEQQNGCAFEGDAAQRVIERAYLRIQADEIEANDVQLCAVDVKDFVFASEQLEPRFGKPALDGLFGKREHIVIAQTAIDAIFRSETGHRADEGRDLF